MTAGWNFERRRDACARLLIGVWMLAKGLPDRDTSLEAVRSRTRLTPEEALFAARRSSEEHLITFEEGGAIRSNARGIERARTLIDGVRAKVERFDDVVKTLDSPGAVAVLACVVRAEGGTLACGAPSSDPDGTYRLALVGDAVTTERRRADGTFEVVSVALENQPPRRRDRQGIEPSLGVLCVLAVY